MKTWLRTILGSPWFNTLLNVASVAVWVLAAVLLVLNLGPFEPPDRLPTTPRLVVNALGAALALIALPGALILWIAMLLYWKNGDTSPKWEKSLWFLLIFFGFCYGASIYFWSRSKSLKSLSTA